MLRGNFKDCSLHTFNSSQDIWGDRSNLIFMNQQIFLSLLGSGLMLTIPLVSQVVSQEENKQPTSELKTYVIEFKFSLRTSFCS